LDRSAAKVGKAGLIIAKTTITKVAMKNRIRTVK